MRKNYKRYQFDFSKEDEKDLKSIKKISRCRTNAETVRRAISIALFLFQRDRDGYVLEMTKGESRVKIKLL